MTMLVFVFLALAANVHPNVGVGVGSASRHPTYHSSNVVGDISIVHLFESVLGKPGSSHNWNKIGDFVLDVVRDELKTKGKEQISIPDVDKVLPRKFGIFKVNAYFTAEKGWFRNLSTLYRIGDVIVTNNDHIFTLQCALGLKEVMLGYDHYMFKVLRLGPSGHFVGTVGNNSIEVIVDLDLNDGKCKAMLKELRITDLEEISVSLNGFGIMNGVVSRMVTEAIERHKTVIIKTVEFNLALEIGKALEKINCEDVFNYILNKSNV